MFSHQISRVGTMILLLGGSLALPDTAYSATSLDSIPIKESGWRYNLTIMREKAKTIPLKARQYQYYLAKLHITDGYVVAYAAALEAKFGTPVATPPKPKDDMNSSPGKNSGIDTVLRRRVVDRVQLNRNAARGMDYLPIADPTAPDVAGTKNIKVNIVKKINLTRPAIDNTYATALPIDIDGKGRYGLIFYNGYNFIDYYSPDGKKIWSIDNPNGRKESRQRAIHRDSWAVLDLDNDGRQDILQCWDNNGSKILVARQGYSGKIISKVGLGDKSTTEGSMCHISVFRMQQTKKPLILVAGRQPGGSSLCGGRNWVDNWTTVTAYDISLKKLWRTNTCDAGHHATAVDANGDGLAENFFVGKYSLDINGKIRCVLQGWDRNDHVDGIRIADVDPRRPGLEAVAVGRTDGAMFDAATCKRLWTVPSTIVNPQEIIVAQLDPAPAPLSIMMTQRGSEKKASTYVIDYKGKIVRKIPKNIMSMKNVEMDGNRRTDEVVAAFGEVFDQFGNNLLSRKWFWNLKGTKTKEVSTRNVWDKWAAFPLVFDMDGDGKDEFVAWGQSLMVIGRPQ